ncbi:TfoX/Sxy family DNA transformation protein [Escherichia coli]|nr:TfoX/Sxy family DNA transformation protein [Escherichia coli]
MKSLSYKRIYKSQEYLATLGTIEYRSLFGSYSLTVDDTVFAMVSDGELYLRACEQSAQYCVKHPHQLKLVRLSKYSLDAALKEKSTRNTRERLKDLPNMSFHLEAILGEVGIKDVRALRILGAKMCWLRLRQQNSLVTEKILFMLEGAIIGIHEAALPVARRQELAEWADSLTPKQEFPAELE